MKLFTATSSKKSKFQKYFVYSTSLEYTKFGSTKNCPRIVPTEGQFLGQFFAGELFLGNCPFCPTCPSCPQLRDKSRIST